jgi:phosphate transport system substrate-binding protein
LLVYQQMPDATKGQAIIDFIKWALTVGQQYAAPLAYAPLPPQVVAAATAQLGTVKAQADNLEIAAR